MLTRAAYMALSTAEREQLDVTALGAVTLRGVPKPVEMYQLDAVPGRTFAALRLDKECCIGDDNEDMESCQSTVEEQHATLDMTASFISNLLSPYNPRQRAEVLILRGAVQ
ncbi:putative receptor-type adenylate cyclase [Trypanosoma theileri]|uniref:Putative receptor-type adenylate cyclase n=1 Tax=Trypanosoma theileri TaxID=67003 RepID=A0A1X0NQC4_9TRYP|nr:putative receptor-type adenylate cyclase [Trypanosoma theileri]ORC86663.1 putative receptor-type adenylate cyclase [Trypanosoma theileri]